MSMHKDRHQQGGFLIASIIIVIFVMGILAVGVMARGRLLGETATRLVVDSQVDWEAQSGLEEATARLMKGQTNDFKASSGAIVIYSPSGTTDVYTAKSFALVNDTGGGFFQTCAVERGVVTNLNFMPEMFIGFDPATTNYVLTLFNNNDLVGVASGGTNPSVVVIGSIDVNNNFGLTNITFNITGSVTGDNSVTNQIKIGYAGTSNCLAVVDAVLDKMTGYDSKIAAGGAAFNLVLKKGVYNPINTAGKTVVLNGGGTVALSGDLMISGGGTVIVKGNLIMNNNVNIVVAPDTQLLVGGNFTANNNVTLVGGDNVLYIQGDATLNNGAGFTVDGGTLVGGDLNVWNNASVGGMLFVEGTLFAHNNFDLSNGILMASELDMQNNVDISITRTAIPQWLAQIVAQLYADGVITSKGGAPESVVRTGWIRKDRENSAYMYKILSNFIK